MVRTVIGDLRVLYLPGMVGELNHVPIECSLEFGSTPELLTLPRQDDLVAGANITAFSKVADVMLAHGLV